MTKQVVREEEAVVVYTEDVVQSLMDYLLDPILPIRSSSTDPSLQHSIAKQMHALVLLYNYYHREQFPHLDFLDFESFCKVAVIAKPSLLLHLKHMQQCNLNTPPLNFSPIEHAMLDACNISSSLNTLKQAPTMEAWPIAQVAVFLIDSNNQNCSLQFGARTQGVWSLIEKDVTESSATMPIKGARTRSFTGSTSDDETRLQQLAISAVKETTGIAPPELSILESYLAYSLSGEKTTTRLFIMKCRSATENIFQVPIKDAIESLKGPLVKKSCGSDTVTEVVEYFHLLPYAGMITDWFCRELSENGSVPSGNLNKNSSSKNNEPLTTRATEKIEGFPATCQSTDFPVLKTNNTGSLDQKENGNHVTECHCIDEGKSSDSPDPNKEKKTLTNFPVDNTALKFSAKTDLKSTQGSSEVKNDKLSPSVETCQNDVDMNDNQAGMHGAAANNDPVVGCIGPCPGDTRMVENSNGVKRMLGFRDGKDVCSMDILKTRITIYGKGDEEEAMLKELASIHFPTDDEPNRPLDTNDKLLLTKAISKVFDDEQASIMIKRVHTCKNWGETDNVRVKILTQRNELLHQSHKRQRMSFHDGSSEIDMETCSGKLLGGSEVMTNDEIENLNQSSAISNTFAVSEPGCGLNTHMGYSPAVVGRTLLQSQQLVSEGAHVRSDNDGSCLDIGGRPIVHETCNGQNVCAGEGVTSPVPSDKIISGCLFAENKITQSLAIPQRTQEDMVSVGSVCFPRQYMGLYKRIVEKFGDIIMPGSKEATLCRDIVSSTLNGLFEVVDSMLHASPLTVNDGLLDSWEMKVRFCEFAGLKVSWLRDHFERVQNAYSSDNNILIQELQGRAVVVNERLEATHKQAADLSNKLEQLRAKERALLEQKKAVDADLEAARVRQECFSFSLF